MNVFLGRPKTIRKDEQNVKLHNRRRKKTRRRNEIKSHEIPNDLMRQMRSSVIMVGAMLR